MTRYEIHNFTESCIDLRPHLRTQLEALKNDPTMPIYMLIDANQLNRDDRKFLFNARQILVAAR